MKLERAMVAVCGTPAASSSASTASTSPTAPPVPAAPAAIEQRGLGGIEGPETAALDEFALRSDRPASAALAPVLADAAKSLH